LRVTARVEVSRLMHAKSELDLIPRPRLDSGDARMHIRRWRMYITAFTGSESSHGGPRDQVERSRSIGTSGRAPSPRPAASRLRTPDQPAFCRPAVPISRPEGVGFRPHPEPAQNG